MNTEKQKLKDQEIVDFLFKEKETFRQEVLVNVKIVSQVAILLVPFFFAGIGLLVKDNEDGTASGFFGTEKLPLLLMLINQVLFLLWMYGLSIVANLAALAGYIMALEEKINHYSNLMISTWEGVVQPRIVFRRNGAQFLSTSIWTSLYLILFIYTTRYIFNNSSTEKWLLLLINCVEIILIVLIFSLIACTRKKSYELTKLHLQNKPHLTA